MPFYEPQENFPAAHFLISGPAIEENFPDRWGSTRGHSPFVWDPMPVKSLLRGRLRRKAADFLAVLRTENRGIRQAVQTA